MGEYLLEVKGLSVSFCQYEKGWKRSRIQVIRDLTVSVRTGEMVAVVGASGSGKSPCGGWSSAGLRWGCWRR